MTNETEEKQFTNKLKKSNKIYSALNKFSLISNLTEITKTYGNTTDKRL